MYHEINDDEECGAVREYTWGLEALKPKTEFVRKIINIELDYLLMLLDDYEASRDMLRDME